MEASCHVSPFGLTKECEKMWDDTQQQMDIDVSLPGIVGDTRIEDGMTNQGEPNDMADNDMKSSSPDPFPVSLPAPHIPRAPVWAQTTLVVSRC